MDDLAAYLASHPLTGVVNDLAAHGVTAYVQHTGGGVMVAYTRNASDGSFAGVSWEGIEPEDAGFLVCTYSGPNDDGTVQWADGSTDTGDGSDPYVNRADAVTITLSAIGHTCT